MQKTLAELEKFVLKHAQVASGLCSSSVAVLASTPKLLDKALAELDDSLKKAARGHSRDSKISLVEELEKANPGLDFRDTRRLIGL